MLRGGQPVRSTVSTILSPQAVLFPDDAKHVHFRANFRPLTSWIFVSAGRLLRAAGRFVLFRPDLIPKQIRAQTEQGCTCQDEGH